MGLLNVGSLVLGLIGWILPVFNFVNSKNKNHDSWAILSFMSISCCAISLCLQIFYNNHLVKIADWSALIDTTGAVTIASTVLLTFTIILNTITMVMHYYRTKN